MGADVTRTPERDIVADMARRAALVAPAIVVVATLAAGSRGAWSALYALAIVLVNFGLSAAILSRASVMSPTATMAAALGGFAVRMGLVVLAIALVDDAAWVSKLTLGATVVATHLGLLVWEAKYLSVSLAFPALKPTRGDA